MGQAATATEVAIGSDLPVALEGARRILVALGEPAAQVGERHRPEWAALFPDSADEAPQLADLANSPSERRLHRDSEQMFRLINAASEAIVEGVAATGQSLVLREAGRADLVTLRCVMRASERARLVPDAPPIVLADLDNSPVWAQTRAGALRSSHLPRVVGRIGTSGETGAAASGDGFADGELGETSNPEALSLRLAADEAADPEARIAAAVLAIRSCFFGTNYEGGLLAAEQALGIAGAAGGLDLDEVQARFAEMDSGLVNPAIEVDGRSLVSEPEIRALLWRSIGVIQAHVGDDAAALEAFERALAEQLEPESTARLHMYKALVFVKRLHQADRGRKEIAAGLSALEGRDQPETVIETAWLRNVHALSYFQEGTLGKAFEEAVLGLRSVAPRHEPHATHLKINLISNLSVLQEVAGRNEDALKTWERFLEVSDGWGPAVMRVHRYRDAGLRLKLGDEEGALKHYREAYEATTELDDGLHQHIVASDLGRAYLDRGQLGEASEWFDRAHDSAAALGDPMSMARSLVGAGLASKNMDEEEIRRLAALSSTFPEDAARIDEAFAAGGSEQLLALLPKPRTKVNIPTLFHLVFV